MTVILKKVRDENKYYPFFVGLRAPIFLLIRSFGGLHFPIISIQEHAPTNPECSSL